MPPRKKSETSTSSGSNSSSGSSSSGSSSSGSSSSGSSSDSSDSSSSSQDSNAKSTTDKAVRRKSSDNAPTKTQKQENEKQTAPVSKDKPVVQKKPLKSASTSEDDTPQQRKQQQHLMTASSKNIVIAKMNESKNRAAANNQKNKRTSRSSQSSVSTSTSTDDDDEPPPQKTNNKSTTDTSKKLPHPADRQIKSPGAVQKQKKMSKSSLHSSDDENPSLPNQSHHVATSKNIANAKKIVHNDNGSGARRKSSTGQAKIKNPPNLPPPLTGGKVPPSVMKQQQAQQQQSKGGSIQPPKRLSQASAGKSKKSIFSPVNSSDSEDDEKRKKSAKNDRRPSNASSSNPALPTPAVPPAPTAPRGRGRPRKQPVEEVVSASSSTTSTDSDSDSDNDSSAGSRRPVSSQAKKLMKKNQKTPTKRTKDDGSEPDVDPKTAAAQKLQLANIRKSTRKASVRKSKHLTGKSETDSDGGESVVAQRSQSKSPVKKSVVVVGKTKAKSGSRKVDSKTGLKSESAVPEERKCGVEGCDSSGHLGGQYEKHFMIEACPVYHNMTHSQTLQHLHERQKRDEERKRLSTTEVIRKGQLTNEQRQYQQRIKDIRSKFKPISPVPTSSVQQQLDKKELLKAKEEKEEREPNLNGLVASYDLMLFKEAQAMASENIENELRQYSSTKGTKFVAMGKFVMEVWYQSPYPEDAARIPKLYLCEFCLRYQKSEVGMKRHAAKCVWRHPPGDEIYRKNKLSVWQVDGKRNKQYCQYLCLLAKFFLDHKTLYYDVEPFLFYVMTLADSDGCHIIGYFSKEKNSFLNYNVSCILTLPPYQRKGVGRLLIDFSYLLTRVENKVGSPEKPLSDLGLISYRSYWKDVLLAYLCSRSGTTLSIKDISQEMAINSYDIVSTLQALGMMKYWKGKHIILKKQDVLEDYQERVKKRGSVLKIDPTCLNWTPFVPPQVAPS